MISIEVTEEPDTNWNKRLLESKLGNIYQTKELASCFGSIYGWENFFLKFINQQGKIVGQLSLFVYSRFDNKGNVGKILKILPGSKKTLYRWYYGPVIFDTTYNGETCKALHDFLIKKNTRVHGFEHPLSPGFLSDMDKPFKINKWATFLIDLSLGKEVLWNKLDKHSARKNIERSIKKEVHLREIDKSSLIHYHEMLKETKSKVGVDIDSSYTDTIWNKLHPFGITGFLAYEKDVPVGGIMVSFFNNYINEWGVARTPQDSDNRLYSQELLKWKIMEWGIENKFRYYDLTGVNPEPKDEKEAGIFRFKQKWGGELMLYNLVTL